MKRFCRFTTKTKKLRRFGAKRTQYGADKRSRIKGATIAVRKRSQRTAIPMLQTPFRLLSSYHLLFRMSRMIPTGRHNFVILPNVGNLRLCGAAPANAHRVGRCSSLPCPARYRDCGANFSLSTGSSRGNAHRGFPADKFQFEFYPSKSPFCRSSPIFEPCFTQRTDTGT